MRRECESPPGSLSRACLGALLPPVPPALCPGCSLCRILQPRRRHLGPLLSSRPLPSSHLRLPTCLPATWLPNKWPQPGLRMRLSQYRGLGCKLALPG